jgi:hypothetical protein
VLTRVLCDTFANLSRFISTTAFSGDQARDHFVLDMQGPYKRWGF